MEQNKDLYCNQYGSCMEKIKQNSKDINELKSDMKQIKEEQSIIKIEQTKDSERIITLFNNVSEIKSDIKNVVNELKKMSEKLDGKINEVNEKPNKFKDEILLKILEIVMVGGIFAYVLLVK